MRKKVKKTQKIFRQAIEKTLSLWYNDFIIEAEIRKHEVFIDIFALHSNIVARVIIKAKELFARLEKADL